MDWAAESLYGKAKTFARRAHDGSIGSAAFGFWMSLSLELLSRAALAKVHPVLLADPQSEDNIHYAFGIVPKKPPRSIQSKAVFARCSVHVPGFTDRMSGHCLILADRRNSELHTGAASFEGIDNSTWLPATYEVIEILLKHLSRDFSDFLGQEHESQATEVLKNRIETRKQEVMERIGAARKQFSTVTEDWIQQRKDHVTQRAAAWVRESSLRKAVKCPVCGLDAIMSGESVGRTPARINEDTGTIQREVRVLPTSFDCPYCSLKLRGYQELNEAGLGAIFIAEEEEDPIEFFGIVPEEHVDIDKLVSKYVHEDYDNE